MQIRRGTLDQLVVTVKLKNEILFVGVTKFGGFVFVALCQRIDVLHPQVE